MAFAVPFAVHPAAGGVWHVYPTGRKVFVAHPVARTAAPTNMGAPATQTGYQDTGSAPAAQPAPTADPNAGTLTPDSQYLTDDAKRQFQVNQGLAANDQQATSNLTTYQEALRRLNARQPIDEQSQTEAANRQGLFYSGHLGQGLSRLADSYVQRRADLQQGFSGQENARLAARAALEQGYPVDDAAARAANADRQIGSDQTSADNNALAVNPAPPPIAPAPQPVVVRMPRPHAPRKPARKAARKPVRRPRRP